MKRLLIITYYWPPTSGSGVQRWLKFVKYLPSMGWQPVIYTPENPERNVTDESLLKEIPPEAEIITQRISEPYALFRKIMGKNKQKDNKKAEAVNPLDGSHATSFKMKVALWLRANFFIPDPRASWINPSSRYLRKYLDDHPVDAIVSTGPPQSMHLIAQKIHKITGIKWIADFRDPWTRIYYFKHLPLTKISLHRHLKLEQQVLNEADSIISVTPQICNDFRHDLKEDTKNSKVYLIENGYDEDDFNFNSKLDKDFTIVFTGLFFTNSNPHHLWNVLKKISNRLPDFQQHLRIELIGKCDQQIFDAINQAGLKQQLHYRGYLPHHEVNKRQKEARTLLLPLSREPEDNGILTGKFFEYLASGRPIIAFGLPKAILDQELTKTNTGRLFDWNEEDTLETYILMLYKDYLEDMHLDSSKCTKLFQEMLTKTGKPCNYPQPIQKEVQRFSRCELTRKLCEILEGHLSN